MNLGMPEMIFIFLLALIIFGPRKLPEIGRQLGRAMSEFKRASAEFQSQLEEEIRQMETIEEHKAQPATLEAENTIHSPGAAQLPEPASVPEGTVAHGDAAGYSEHGGPLPGVPLAGVPLATQEADRELGDPGLDHLTAAQGHDA